MTLSQDNHKFAKLLLTKKKGTDIIIVVIQLTTYNLQHT
jgi:hypothetical protein